MNLKKKKNQTDVIKVFKLKKKMHLFFVCHSWFVTLVWKFFLGSFVWFPRTSPHLKKDHTC
jgi:hypothetical protein